jgi:hypothetical protein
LVAILASSRLLAAQALQIVRDLPVLSRSVSVNECSPSKFVSGSSKWAHIYINHDGPHWMRLKLSVVSASFKDWHVEVKDEEGKGTVIETLLPTRFSETNGTAWTGIVRGASVEIELVSNDDIDGMTLCIDSVNVPRTALTVKSTIGKKDDRTNLVDYFGIGSRYYAYGKAVAMIRFQDVANGGDETNCTGVLVAPTLIATSYHCIDLSTPLSTACAFFGYESGGEVDKCDIQSRLYSTAHVLRVVAHSSVLDYSILRIDRSESNVAAITSRGLKKKAPLIVIQHPEGQPKMIAFADIKTAKCFVEQSPATGRKSDFFHLCDTSGGSSGSPVMDEQTGVVYGLHHIGESNPKTHDYHNLAVFFSDILGDMKKDYLSIHDEIVAQGSYIPANRRR